MRYILRSCGAYDAKQLVEVLSNFYRMDQISAVNFFISAFVIEVKPPRFVAVKVLTGNLEYYIEGNDVIFNYTRET